LVVNICEKFVCSQLQWWDKQRVTIPIPKGSKRGAKRGIQPKARPKPAGQMLNPISPCLAPRHTVAEGELTKAYVASPLWFCWLQPTWPLWLALHTACRFPWQELSLSGVPTAYSASLPQLLNFPCCRAAHRAYDSAAHCLASQVVL
jgi:hypothetical protein